MNREMVKEIKYNIDECNICNSDELNKSIIVQVDKGLLDKDKRITGELIDIGYSDLYKHLLTTLNESVKYIKRVNFKKPFKQNIMGKFIGIALDADYLSSTTWLYTSLLDMVQILPFFDILFKKLDDVEREFKDMISYDVLSGVTAFNKASLVSQMEGLKQMKFSLLTLYECYANVLKNPQVKEFFFIFLEYKKSLLCKRYQEEATELNDSLLSKINKL